VNSPGIRPDHGLHRVGERAGAAARYVDAGLAGWPVAAPGPRARPRRAAPEAADQAIIGDISRKRPPHSLPAA